MTQNLPEKEDVLALKEYFYTFHTFDLGVAAVLVTKGFKLIMLDKTNPRKVKFIFFQAGGIEKVVDDYWSDCLKVNARSFFDNMKMLKNRMYSE